MNKKNDFINILIPIIAVVVIFESVMLIQNMTKTHNTATNNKVEDKREDNVDVSKENTSVFDIKITGENTSLKLGQKQKLVVTGKSLKELSVDAISLFIKYDPEMVEISDLTGGKTLPKPTFSKISTKTGYVVTHYFIMEEKGLALVKDSDFDLMSFEIKPKKTGMLSFEIGTGTDMPESVTMIVDNATRKAVPYSSNNKLEINVEK